MAKRQQVTREHSQLLKGIAIWLDEQSETTPLERGVFQEIVERVENHAKHGAYVRVRLMNRGRQPIRAAASVVPLIEEQRQHLREGSKGRRPWSVEEIAQLQRDFYDNMTIRDIAEKMDRTEDGIQQKVCKLGMKRRPGGRRLGIAYKENPVLAAARRLREQREMEAAD